jgi:Asp-tRNA(Asn)/Glu-tRNA(Gln) amidotransferase A subunit family amidase
MKNVLTLSGLRQAQPIRKGAISSTELVAAHLDRIREVNPSLNAVVEVLAPANAELNRRRHWGL